MNDLTADDREWLHSHGVEHRVQENEKIIVEGTIPEAIYIVKSGLFVISSVTNDQLALVEPGGIIGTMGWFTGTRAVASVFALEPDSIVLAIPHNVLATHLAADSQFASRFYRVTATILSQRLLNLIETFVSRSRLKLPGKIPALSGPIKLFEGDLPNYHLIEAALTALPSLSATLLQYKQNKNIDAALQQREKNLSVATVSAASIKLLLDIATKEGVTNLENRIITHPPSLTAVEKQAILSPHLIQKTVTMMIDNTFILCSGIGDFKIHHDVLREISQLLNLPHANINSYINPAIFVPEIELGLLRGMVSTFIAPGRITQISLVIFLDTGDIEKKESKDVAISLSPFESLLIPLQLFPRIIQQYSESAYAYIPFAFVKCA